MGGEPQAFHPYFRLIELSIDGTKLFSLDKLPTAAKFLTVRLCCKSPHQT